MQPQSKQCEVCGTTFNRPPNRSAKQWERMRFHSTACANTWRARRQKRGAARRRRDMGQWATQWERERRREDREDLARKPKVWPHCKLSHRPKARRFIGHRCQACEGMWVSFEAMPDTIYCKPCNRARWRETHYARAERYGVQFDVIDPTTIFDRDGWRCQLCGAKTITAWPHPRRATLDHIIPLARGGNHTATNLQCACWTCNIRKGARSANDQLLLDL